MARPTPLQRFGHVRRPGGSMTRNGGPDRGGDAGYICSFWAAEFGRALPRSGFWPIGAAESFAV